MNPNRAAHISKRSQVQIYDAILFDFDGVLADTEPIHFACWRELLTPYGIDLTWQFYVSQCVGVSDREMVNVLRLLAKPNVELEKLWAEYPKKKELFSCKAAARPPISDETVNLIKSLSNYKLAVVSSSGRSEVEPILKRAGILDQFGSLVFGGDVTNCKPHPEPYLRAASELSAQRSLVVEDSEAGAASGGSAGFDVLKLDNPVNLTALLDANGIGRNRF